MVMGYDGIQARHVSTPAPSPPLPKGTACMLQTQNRDPNCCTATSSEATHRSLSALQLTDSRSTDIASTDPLSLINRSLSLQQVAVSSGYSPLSGLLALRTPPNAPGPCRTHTPSTPCIQTFHTAFWVISCKPHSVFTTLSSIILARSLLLPTLSAATRSSLLLYIFVSHFSSSLTYPPLCPPLHTYICYTAPLDAPAHALITFNP